jgi:hypothetical protein
MTWLPEWRIIIGTTTYDNVLSVTMATGRDDIAGKRSDRVHCDRMRQHERRSVIVPYPRCLVPAARD